MIEQRFQVWLAIALAVSVVAKVGEWVLRYRYRRQAMRGFKAMERSTILRGRAR